MSMKVEIIYNYRKKTTDIYFDGDDLTSDFDYIQNKDISAWFEQNSSGREQWKGFIKEIESILDCDISDIQFDFQGNDESKQIFNTQLQKIGISNNQVKVDVADVIADSKKRAEIQLKNNNSKGVLEHLKKAADLGDEKSFLSYLKTLDTDDALSGYTDLANRGNKEAMYNLYIIYKQDKQDDEQSFYWAKKLADLGDLELIVEVANCYYYGEGVKEDAFVAFDYYQIAADQGNDNAQFMIGSYYQLGEKVVSEDLEMSFKYFKLSADQGHEIAQSATADCYYNGWGTDKNLEKAFEYFKKAADNGHVDSQNRTGFRYDRGEGVSKNLVEAVKYYKMAADNGHEKAQCNLANCYYYGAGVDENNKLAFEYYKKSADQGHAIAQRSLARCYYYGEGVDENRKLAFEYYKKSADQGDAIAQYRLARCYYYGEGTDVDDKLALNYFKLAADQENRLSQHMVGECYFNGYGTSENNEECFKYWTSAYDNGCYYSKVRLISLYRQGLGTDKDIDAALSCLEEFSKVMYDEDTYRDWKKESFAERFYKMGNTISHEKGFKDQTVLNTVLGGVLAATAILVPVSNLITIPAAVLIGAGKGVIDWGGKVYKMSEEDKETALMISCLKISSDLGNEDATKRLKYIQNYK
ncbi:MAG: SEL1-like repeat protein [Clostridia bacterium]